MTTEYRDGYLSDLTPGDGFSADELVWPDRRYLGDNRWLSLSGQEYVIPAVWADEPIRIWPGYFLKQEEFDIEAFRAKLEEMREATILDSVDFAYRQVLDLLPPKPQPTPEEIIGAHRVIWPDDGQPERCSCGHQFKIGESISRHQIEPLREAGWLRDSLVKEES